jgi:hypothetical protein
MKSMTVPASSPVVILVGYLVLCAAPVLAQSQGRVIRDNTTIWRADAGIMAAAAKAGTILDVTARSDRWYEVIIPVVLGGHGERGLIALKQLQLMPGSVEPPFRQLGGPNSAAQHPGMSIGAKIGLVGASGFLLWLWYFFAHWSPN